MGRWVGVSDGTFDALLGIAWLLAGVTMMGHGVAWTLGITTATGPTWWVAISLLGFVVGATGSIYRSGSQ